MDLKILYKLKQGEAVCFNNRRVLHGRKGFQLNGIRHFQVKKKILQFIIVYIYVIIDFILKGCYINIDEFKSEVLAKENFLKHKLKNRSISPNNLEGAQLAYGNNDYK